MHSKFHGTGVILWRMFYSQLVVIQCCAIYSTCRFHFIASTIPSKNTLYFRLTVCWRLFRMQKNVDCDRIPSAEQRVFDIKMRVWSKGVNCLFTLCELTIWVSWIRYAHHQKVRWYIEGLQKNYLGWRVKLQPIIWVNVILYKLDSCFGVRKVQF